MAASTPLLPGPDPSYRFLPGGEPYSSGAVATPGWEVIHATLQAPVPWREGFAAIERHLRALGRPRTALCAIELRIPTPLTFAGFAEFNRGYRALLGEWGLLVDGRNPVARTNVAPVVGPPAEPSLYAFSYTVAAEEAGGPTFVAAGSGELRPGPASRASVVRPDETSADALAGEGRARDGRDAGAAHRARRHVGGRDGGGCLHRASAGELPRDGGARGDGPGGYPRRPLVPVSPADRGPGLRDGSPRCPARGAPPGSRSTGRRAAGAIQT